MTLKELRARAGLLQKDVARRADVSIIAVSNWELGKNGIARKYKKKLVRLYGCTPQELDEAIEGSRKEENDAGRYPGNVKAHNPRKRGGAGARL